MDMNYCMQCGARLRMKEHETEGHPVPWCDTCGDYRFPVFNAAVSMGVDSEKRIARQSTNAHRAFLRAWCFIRMHLR